MRRPIEFDKYDALGNDFILVEEQVLPAAQIREMCRRRSGIGADGLIILKKIYEAEINFEIYNADGSPGGISGNGLRCAALHIRRKNRDIPTCCFKAAGKKIFTRIEGESIEIRFPGKQTSFSPPLPEALNPDGLLRVLQAPLARVSILDVGNPHLVIMGETIRSPQKFGTLIDTLRRPGVLCPSGINVSLARVEQGGSIRLWTWERGVGRTPSCASAALAAFIISGLDRAETLFDTGKLLFAYQEGGPVMVGSARWIFEGRYVYG